MSAPGPPLLNLDASVLAFHARVLELAEDPRVPLLERVRFLSIFGANLDEFTITRLASLHDQLAWEANRLSPDGLTPAEQLAWLAPIVRALLRRASELWDESLLPELRGVGIEIVPFSAWRPEHRDALAAWAREHLLPRLLPLGIGADLDGATHVRSLRPTFVVDVEDDAGQRRTWFVPLPEGCPRFVPLAGRTRFAWLEDVVRAELPSLIGDGLRIRGAYLVRVARSAELELADRASGEEFVRALQSELLERPFRPAVRLDVTDGTPEDLIDGLVARLRREHPRCVLDPQRDVFVVTGPLDLRALRELAALPHPALRYPPARVSCPFDPARSVAEQVRERDYLIVFPRDSFEQTVERWLWEAARDPATHRIALTIYRTSQASRVIRALTEAARRGVRVEAFVELKARFDERRNLEWLARLADAGATVAYGLPYLKVHAKVGLVERQEDEGLRRYAYIGTGNLNWATASAYTDLGLLTAHPALADEVALLFDVLFRRLTGLPSFRHLLVAPVNLRQRFLELIDREIRHAQAGRGGRIWAKMNGLADTGMVAALYDAAAAGVDVQLIVRSLCTLRPGVPGRSERIRVVSVLGRYLEHMRIFYFANAGRPDVYLGSADWRTRNLSRRIEVVTPVYDVRLQDELLQLLTYDLERSDAWELHADGVYRRRRRPAG